MPDRRPLLLRLFLGILFLASALPAQTPAEPAPTTQPNNPQPTPATLFPHSDTSRFLAVGQANIIFQAHAPFHCPYAGANSLLGRGEYKTSLIGTLYLGAQLVRAPRFNTDLLLDFESAGGRGISEALGLAGFTNLDVVRNPTLGSKPYIARVQLHQTIGLGNELVDSPRTPFSLATRVPLRRLDIRIGKMSLPDVLDLNSIGTDSHLQFLNWTVDNNGAWDYAADTRGYTYAAVVEYDDRALVRPLRPRPHAHRRQRHRSRLEPPPRQRPERRVRAPPHPPAQPCRARPQRQHPPPRLRQPRQHGPLSRPTIAPATATDPPVITAHPPATTVKYGVGLNAEQELTPNLRAFGRFGWNEGQHESFAYTEVDQTIEFGADYSLRATTAPSTKPASPSSRTPSSATTRPT